MNKYIIAVLWIILFPLFIWGFNFPLFLIIERRITNKFGKPDPYSVAYFFIWILGILYILFG